MEQVKQTVDLLMEKLVRDGFPEDQLRDQIEEAVTMNLSAFRVNCAASYGEEKMSYELSFVQTPNPKLPYIFTELHATHRDPVDIDHHVINGIDTLTLDQLMAGIDWALIFSGGAYENTDVETGLIGDLRKLAEDDSAHGKFIQQCLMYKYWPKEVFQKYRAPDTPDFQKVHEHSYTFKAASGEVLNAHLAYHIISERYDSLRDIVDGIGLQELGGNFPAYDLLSGYLGRNLDAFSLDGHFTLPEGYAEFSVPIEKINGWYSIQEYELTFTPYPPISHGVFAGINTEELEAEMRLVDWKKDHTLFTLSRHGEPTFSSAIESIHNRLFLIGQDLAGTQVADMLRLKYFIDVTFLEDSIEQPEWNKLSELPKLKRKFPAEYPIRSAACMLAGRATFCLTGPGLTSNIRHWQRLDLTDTTGQYPAKIFEGFSRKELEDALRPVCGTEADRIRLATEIAEGRLARLETHDEKVIFIEATPRTHDLRFYSPDMRPIPVNLHLDPDWNPTQSSEQKNETRRDSRLGPPMSKNRRTKKGRRP